MKRNKRLLILLLFSTALMALLTSCLDDENDPRDEYIPLKTFYAIDISQLSTDGCPEEDTVYPYYPIEAKLQYSGSHSVVYCETEQIETVSQNVFTYIGDQFDSMIFPLVTGAIGDPPDSNHDQKVTILLLDIRDGYSSSYPYYIEGYFDPLQLFSFDYGIQQDIYYMDMDPTDINPNSSTFQRDTMTTFAHEFTHMCLFNQRILKKYPNILTTSVQESMMQDSFHFEGELDLWIEEGLAQLSEQLFSGEPLEDRIRWYDDDSGDYSCEDYSAHTIRDGWPLVSWWDSVNDYALSYLFMAYIYAQSGNNLPFIQDIISSEYDDAQAIVEASIRFQLIQEHQGFKDLLGNFFLALLFQKSTGVYGFMDTPISLNDSDWTTMLQGTVDLYPGGRILVPLPKDFAPVTQTYIGYIGLDLDNQLADWDASDGLTGDRVLIYNYDMDELGGAITVAIPSF